MLSAQADRLGADEVNAAIDNFTRRITEITAASKKKIIDAERHRDLATEEASVAQRGDSYQSEKLDVRGEDQVPQTRKKRGRPAVISVERKLQASKVRAEGASWREVAKVLYGSLYPTESQVKNSPNVLNHFQRTTSPPNNSSLY